MFIIKVITTARYAVIIIIIVIIAINYIGWKVSKLARVKKRTRYDIITSPCNYSFRRVLRCSRLCSLTRPLWSLPTSLLFIIIIINIHRRFWYEITPIQSSRCVRILSRNHLSLKRRKKIQNRSLVRLVLSNYSGIHDLRARFAWYLALITFRKIFANKKQYSSYDGRNKGRSSNKWRVPKNNQMRKSARV